MSVDSEPRAPDAPPRGRIGEPPSLAARCAVLFLLGCALFAVPTLWPARVDARVLGVPLLYVFLFVSWAAFIGALAWLLEARAASRGPEDGS
jgi:hypothetical protein